LLLQLFPEAQFIFIYRNPYDVFASSKRFWQIINRYYAFRPVKEYQKLQLIMETYSSMMNRYLETKQLIPSHRLVEVQYEALAANPEAQLKAVYSKLNLGDFSLVQPAVRHFIEKAKGYERVHYTLTQREKEMVDSHWQPFLSLWTS
jgi:F0F1-type ATP synthase gamma subunit